MSDGQPIRGERGKFLSGHSMGRPKGSRNKLAESFLDALHKDFETNGVAAIVAARGESPLGYVKMIASLLPQKVEVEKTVSNMTDEELLVIIANERRRVVPAADDTEELGRVVN